ncbi:MAG: DUF2397 family protein, partial [Cetobacterium sp.]
MNFRQKIDEVRYITAENTERYRAIMRCMFDSFNSMSYWLYKEEIMEILRDYIEFENYTIEQLNADLNSLLEWKNLIADVDTANVASITEFKNRKFKYQISKNSIEIEKMLITLENLSVNSNSHLSSNFILKFTILLSNYKKVKKGSQKDMYEWWNELKLSFTILNDNYTSFVSQFSS